MLAHKKVCSFFFTISLLLVQKTCHAQLEDMFLFIERDMSSCSTGRHAFVKQEPTFSGSARGSGFCSPRQAKHDNVAKLSDLSYEGLKVPITKQAC